MSSDEMAIRVRNVSKHYLMFDKPEDRLKQMVVPRLMRLAGRPPRRYFRDFAAVNDVSFEVRRGETIGIIGRNGSGKSTTLQMVCGTLQPSSGSIEVNGRIAALLELGAGFNPEFTGRENVYLNAAILGLSRKETEQRFDDIARFADIGIFIDQPVKTYSSGMYVRLAFAVAINVDPDILVVDEALSVGDEAFQRKCFARIEDIRDRGGTILFVTHGVQTVVQLCDRAMLFDRGELILQGRPKFVTGQYQRLANASEQMAPEIRAQIAAMNDAPPQQPAVQSVSDFDDAFGKADATSPQSSAAAPAVSPALAAGAVAELERPLLKAEPPIPSEMEGLVDYYDTNLVSQSEVELERRGARIRDISLRTMHGDRVNGLSMGRRYVFDYWVDFDVDARDVGFGMWFRTVDGYGLAGAQSFDVPALRQPSIAKGKSARVRYEFDCQLTPGTYFCSCGLWGRVGGEVFLMHRIIDGYVFRVVPEANLLATGRFNLNPSLNVSIGDQASGALAGG